MSLLYWVAAFGDNGGRDGAAIARLLLDHGADPEVRFQGNGERGNTALQEAVAPGWDDDVNRGKRRIATTMVEYGAYYDVFSACGLDDLDRLQVLGREDSDIAQLRGEAGNDAAAPGDVRRQGGGGGGADRAGADAQRRNKGGKTPLQIARKECRWLKE